VDDSGTRWNWQSALSGQMSTRLATSFLVGYTNSDVCKLFFVSDIDSCRMQCV